ncbi:hypothetical protein K466DRAFT_152709 [Polyporus arcularius HHB13444]|uniref:Uncharacterized protein n=1 Tax=Polyporus arcularius HHB13444 TaxID=1314778 RepID=A0A5C3PBR1_9APHY|nr:hypothetical protein K466DRAFT_152709 [Polyporus arcularius HHB13444]
MAPGALATETPLANQLDGHPDSNASDSTTQSPTFRFADLPLTVKRGGIRGKTLRESYTESFRVHFPDFKPRGDIDIMVFGGSLDVYDGPEDGIYAWVDKEFAQHAGRWGGGALALRAISRSLDTFVEVTGTKPKRGDACPNVFVCPIPNCAYSVRLFPGAFVRQQYCLDFVNSETGEPVNSPFEFELWAVHAPSWMGLVVPKKIVSQEEAYGIRLEDIKPGLESFVLRDGMACLLKRPGHRDVRFVVPIRVE